MPVGKKKVRDLSFDDSEKSREIPQASKTLPSKIKQSITELSNGKGPNLATDIDNAIRNANTTKKAFRNAIKAIKARVGEEPENAVEKNRPDTGLGSTLKNAVSVLGLHRVLQKIEDAKDISLLLDELSTASMPTKHAAGVNGNRYAQLTTGIPNDLNDDSVSAQRHCSVNPNHWSVNPNRDQILRDLIVAGLGKNSAVYKYAEWALDNWDTLYDTYEKTTYGFWHPPSAAEDPIEYFCSRSMNFSKMKMSFDLNTTGLGMGRYLHSDEVAMGPGSLATIGQWERFYRKVGSLPDATVEAKFLYTRAAVEKAGFDYYSSGAIGSTYSTSQYAADRYWDEHEPPRLWYEGFTRGQLPKRLKERLKGQLPKRLNERPPQDVKISTVDIYKNNWKNWGKDIPPGEQAPESLQMAGWIMDNWEKLYANIGVEGRSASRYWSPPKEGEAPSTYFDRIYIQAKNAFEDDLKLIRPDKDHPEKISDSKESLKTIAALVKLNLVYARESMDSSGPNLQSHGLPFEDMAVQLDDVTGELRRKGYEIWTDSEDKVTIYHDGKQIEFDGEPTEQSIEMEPISFVPRLSDPKRKSRPSGPQSFGGDTYWENKGDRPTIATLKKARGGRTKPRKDDRMFAMLEGRGKPLNSFSIPFLPGRNSRDNRTVVDVAPQRGTAAEYYRRSPAAREMLARELRANHQVVNNVTLGGPSISVTAKSNANPEDIAKSVKDEWWKIGERQRKDIERALGVTVPAEI